MKTIPLKDKDYDAVKDFYDLQSANLALLRRHFRKRLFTVSPGTSGVSSFIVNGDTQIDVGDRAITIQTLPPEKPVSKPVTAKKWQRTLANGAPQDAEFLAFRAEAHGKESFYFLVSKEWLHLSSGTLWPNADTVALAEDRFLDGIKCLRDGQGNQLIPEDDYQITWERGRFGYVDFAIY